MVGHQQKRWEDQPDESAVVSCEAEQSGLREQQRGERSVAAGPQAWALVQAPLEPAQSGAAGSRVPGAPMAERSDGE